MTASPRPSLWRLPALRALLWLSMLGITSYCLTIASLPSYAVAGGTGVALAGLVTTAMLTATVLVQITVPRLVLRWGSARVMAGGLVALGAPSPLYLLEQDLWWLVSVSVVRGAGFAVLTVLGTTLTALIAPVERRGEAIGLYGLAVAVPTLIAVPAGVALTLAGRFDIVAVLAASPVLALPLVRGLVRTPSLTASHWTPAGDGAGAGAGGRAGAGAGGGATDRASHRASHRADSRTAVRAALAPSIILLVVTLAGGGVVTFLPIERPSGAVASLALLVFGILGALSRWQVGSLADRIGHRWLLPAAVLTAILGMLGLAVGLVLGTDTTATASVLVAAAVFGVGYGAVQNLTLVVAFARAGAEHPTTASAVWNASFDAGTAIGAFAVGALAAAGPGLAWSYVACAAVMALALPLTRLRASGAVLSTAANESKAPGTKE